MLDAAVGQERAFALTVEISRYRSFATSLANESTLSNMIGKEVFRGNTMWSAIGSVGVANAADLAQLQFVGAIAQLGGNPPIVAGPGVSSTPVTPARVAPLPKRKATLRWSIPDIFNGIQPNSFGVRIRTGDGEIVTRLIEVTVLGGGTTESDPGIVPENTLITFDDVSALPGFPPDAFRLFRLGITANFDFINHAYYVEIALTRPTSALGIETGYAPAVATVQLGSL